MKFAGMEGKRFPPAEIENVRDKKKAGRERDRAKSRTAIDSAPMLLIVTGNMGGSRTKLKQAH